jgi:hypothetical protein
MDDEVVCEYLRLALRMGKLVEGFVDCWFGDPTLAREVDAEPPPLPLDIAARAAGLRSALGDTGIARPRQRFLAAQLTGLECSARRLAGIRVPFQDEVHAYFDVDIGLGDPDRYAQVHAAISELLPGSGSRRARVEAFYERNLIPPDRFQRAIQAVSDELRVKVRPVLGLPDRERVEYEIVRDEPWNAFNRYLGDFRSAVALNVRAGRTIAAVPLIVTHESYPGHHTERCRKEAGLVNGRGHTEHAIALVNTPQCLVAEGTAEHGATALLGDGWGGWTAELLAEHDVYSDGELVERMVNLVRQLMPARQDAAILLHDRGADADEVVRYLERWLLLPADRAEHMVRFLLDPVWRAYSVTYVEGARLVGEWLAARPPEQPIIDRYRVLLDEPLLPSMLEEELRRPGSAQPSRSDDRSKA